jgi:hypothetical protein
MALNGAGRAAFGRAPAVIRCRVRLDWHPLSQNSLPLLEDMQ